MISHASRSLRSFGFSWSNMFLPYDCLTACQLVEHRLDGSGRAACFVAAIMFLELAGWMWGVRMRFDRIRKLRAMAAETRLRAEKLLWVLHRSACAAEGITQAKELLSNSYFKVLFWPWSALDCEIWNSFVNTHFCKKKKKRLRTFALLKRPHVDGVLMDTAVCVWWGCLFCKHECLWLKDLMPFSLLFVQCRVHQPVKTTEFVLLPTDVAVLHSLADHVARRE